MFREKLFYVLIGALVASSVFVLVGATDISPPNYGRYQVSSWSSPIGTDSVAVGAFIVDSATGETKMVMQKTVSAKEMGLSGKDDTKKMFHAIR